MPQNFVEPAKVKVVDAIGNVPIGDAEIGELFYDATSNYLYIRVIAGWKRVAAT